MKKKSGLISGVTRKIQKSIIYKWGTAIGNRTREDQLSAFAAQSAFFLLLSAFPFVMILLIAIKLLPMTQNELMDMAAAFIPARTNEYFAYMINEIYDTPVGVTMAVSVVVAIWSASKGTMAVERGLNFMDKVVDTKNYFFRRIVNAFYTVIFCVMLIATLGVYVLGNNIIEAIINHTPISEYSDTILFYSQLLTGPVLVFAVIILIYCRLPDNHIRVKESLVGAVFTTLCWIGLSVVFSIYINHFGINTYMYGNLGGMIIAMLWLYACMYCLFLGAEINKYFREEFIRKVKALLGRRRKKYEKNKDEKNSDE
jgi:membrane protein